MTTDTTNKTRKHSSSIKATRIFKIGASVQVYRIAKSLYIVDAEKVKPLNGIKIKCPAAEDKSTNP